MYVITLTTGALYLNCMSRKKVTIKPRAFTVVLREEDVGGYSVQCLELPGAISQGETKEEALKNIKEAIEGYLEAFPEIKLWSSNIKDVTSC